MANKKKSNNDEGGFGRVRSMVDYRRHKGRKAPGKVIVIVCEGEETEPNYFGSLRRKFRLSPLIIKVLAGKGSPVRIVECAIEEKKKLDDAHDEVWCVLDTEAPANNPGLKSAVERAKKSKINLAISNPCFEYWYYIHFDETSRPFANGQEMKRRLKDYISNYDESMDVFPVLDDLTSVAIKHAEKLRKRSQESWDIFPNPSTGVDKLVKEIIEMGQVKRY